MPGIFAVTIFLLLLVYSLIKKPSKGRSIQPLKKPAPPPAPQPAKQLRSAPVNPIPSVTVPISPSNDLIDVSGQTEKIPVSRVKLTPPEKPVALWPAVKIDSLNDFQNTTREQRSFYFYFRNNFLQDICLDLKGNSNYAFVLLFDLAGEYDSHKDPDRLKHQFTLLSQAYPATATQAGNILSKRLIGKQPAPPPAFTPVPNPDLPVYGTSVYGVKYKEVLSLSDSETSLLNYIYNYSNLFFDHPSCQQAVFELFVRLLRQLEKHFAVKNETLDTKFDIIADIVARKNFHFRSGSENYKYILYNARADLRILILKHCENGVREAWDYKRRLTVNHPWAHEDVIKAINELLIAPIETFLPELIRHCPAADETAEFFLNAQNTTRWKSRLDLLKAQYNPNDNAGFYQKLIELAKTNKDNPSIENIFFEGAKFIGKKDIPLCLSLYLHYIYHDQHSQTIDDKALGKLLLKSLFQTTQIESSFDDIVKKLKEDNNLDAALNAVPELFTRKRKKIDLNPRRIGEAKTAYIHTVDVLTQYLDESDSDLSASQHPPVSTDPIPPNPVLATEINLTPKDPSAAAAAANPSPAAPSAGDQPAEAPVPSLLTPVQRKFLLVFAQNNMLLSSTDIDAFARENTVFRNAFIDGINEACFEILEDLLIEQEGENYILQENYLIRINANQH